MRCVQQETSIRPLGVQQGDAAAVLLARHWVQQVTREPWIASLRERADLLVKNAQTLEGSALELRRLAHDLRDEAERTEWLPVEWSDLRAGDEIKLSVFGIQTGWERETRSVVAVDGDVIRLREGDREYDFNISTERQADRRGLCRRAANSHSKIGEGTDGRN